MKKILISLLLILPFKSTFSASFDCNLASNTAEKIICTDTEASKTDEYFSEYYHSVSRVLSTSEKSTFKKLQIHWITSSRNKCDTPLCIVNSYKSRELEIEKWLKTKIREPLESEKLSDPLTERQEAWQNLTSKLKKHEEVLEASYRRQLKEAYDGPYSNMTPKNLAAAKRNWDIFLNNYCSAIGNIYGGMRSTTRNIECKIKLMNSFAIIDENYGF